MITLFAFLASGPYFTVDRGESVPFTMARCLGYVRRWGSKPVNILNKQLWTVNQEWLSSLCDVMRLTTSQYKTS